MPNIWLIRHGQAGDLRGDYDRLSDRGREQSRLAGVRARHIGEVAVVHTGAMKRHHQTREEFEAGFGPLPAAHVDPGWNEFDHQDVIRKAIAAGLEPPSNGRGRAAFSQFFFEAMGRWALGEHDDYVEPYAMFQARVERALNGLVDQLGSGQTAMVFTSGGAISAVCRKLLDLQPQHAFELNTVMVNTGLTRLRVGRGQVSLATLNSHPHFDERPELLTLS